MVESEVDGFVVLLVVLVLPDLDVVVLVFVVSVVHWRRVVLLVISRLFDGLLLVQTPSRDSAPV